MPGAVASHQVQTLIVTDNFIEAEDLADAISEVAREEIMHLRHIDEAVPFLEDVAFTPKLAVLHIPKPSAKHKKLLERLHARGVQLVLIDAAPQLLGEIEAEALSRPFTGADLSTVILKLRQDAKDLKPPAVL